MLCYPTELPLKIILSQHNNYQKLTHTSPCINEFIRLMVLHRANNKRNKHLNCMRPHIERNSIV
jgi:trimethylamine:corrinoid methyltransferase-like protein